MKKLLFFLLFPVVFYSQNDSITTVKPKFSVIGLDRINVVYRGIPNPISIAVNDAKSYKITGNGVSQNEDGKYVIRPGAGTETKVFVEIEKNDGSKVIEEHVFRIKGLPHPIGAINNECTEENYFEFKKEDLRNAEISIEFLEFLFDIKFKELISFSIFYKKKEFIVEGNTINESAFNFIKKVRKNSIIVIKNIYYPHSPESLPIRVQPIIIKLTD